MSWLSIWRQSVLEHLYIKSKVKFRNSHSRVSQQENSIIIRDSSQLHFRLKYSFTSFQGRRETSYNGLRPCGIHPEMIIQVFLQLNYCVDELLSLLLL